MESKTSPSTKSASWAAPIFILGIMGRSGTNFLYDLLCLHPDCQAGVLWEDFVVAPANFLANYVDFVSSHAKPAGGVDENSLYQSLGNGLMAFLTPPADDKRFVTKTPSVHNLECFFRLFPNAHLLILVRDGRAVVESGVNSDIGWDYEGSMRGWAEAARTILRFDQANKNSNFEYLLVKYEELYSNPHEELGRIFTFLDLDTEAYDFEAALNLPVRGSSAFHGQDTTNTHWKPVEKTVDFNPLLRWSRWDRALHERFNWLAGQYLVQFGYEEKQYTGNRFLWAVRNRLLDLRWDVRKNLEQWSQKRILREVLRKADSSPSWETDNAPG